MLKSLFLCAAFAAPLFGSNLASAATTLTDHDGWKVDIYGFVDNDMTSDTTRSFTEVLGNGAVSRPGSLAGDNGRVQDSIRNSRLGFIVSVPEQSGWKSKGVLEMDFLGYEPSQSNTGTPPLSESAFEQNPTLRVRHVYLNTEKDGYQVIAGQTWSLFGWQPYYQPAVVSVAPEAAELYQRTAQLGTIKTWTLGDSNRLQFGASIEKPSQRDSGVPNIDVGVRYAFDGIKTATVSSYGDYHLESLSVGVSGTFKQFETYNGSTTSNNKQYASAVAGDVFIPIIPASDATTPQNSLALIAEVTAGTGYGDSLPSWSAGMTGATATAAPSSAYTGTNVDAGFGVFDANGAFDLLQLQTWNATLQYVLPFETHQTVDVGMAYLQSTNLTQLSLTANTNGVPASLNSVYDRVTNQYVNYWIDCTKQIRFGAEYSFQTTHYIGDGLTANNTRVQFTALYRF